MNIRGDVHVGIIGAGNMGSALAEAFLQSNLCSSSELLIIENNAIQREKLEAKFGCRTLSSINSSIKDYDLIFLAVKPQQCMDLCRRLASEIITTQVICSIMAGVTLATLQEILGGDIPIIRAMPNLPLQVREGMTAYCSNKNIDGNAENLVEMFLGTVGKVLKVKREDLIDAATAVSGSGPAYVFRFIEIMIDGACRHGFSREEAILLVQQTFYGAVEHMNNSDDEISVLRQKVTSPGGTTEAALDSFEHNKLHDVILEGIESAYKRSKELAR